MASSESNAGVGGVARVAVGVGPDPGPRRRLERGDRSAGGPRLAVGGEGLEVDACLDREAAWRRDFFLREPEVAQGLAGGDAELRLHQVESGNRLGNRVLHLQPGVGLQKAERGSVAEVGRVHQKLERAEAAVAGGGGHALGRLNDAGAQRGRQPGCRGNLDQLLVAPLGAAFTLAELHDLGAVAEDLDLDVAGARHHLLHVQRAVAERPLRLGPTPFEGGRNLLGAGHGAGAATAAAGNGLDHHRGAGGQPREEGGRLLDAGRASGPGQHCNVVRYRRSARPQLVAEQLQRLDRRPDKAQPARRTGARKGRTLGQESVAGVDRVATGLARQPHHLRAVQVGGHAVAGQRQHLVGQEDVQRRRVVLRVDGDGGDAEIGGGAGHAHRDLAAVRNQKFLERHGATTVPSSWAAASRQTPAVPR